MRKPLISGGFCYTKKEEKYMRNVTIDLVWTKIQTAVAAIGGYLGYFVGGVDGLMTALINLHGDRLHHRPHVRYGR